ncbi:MAG TPA: GDSL-type esterase/lipase family protein [Chitinophagaceae bacterium]
MQNKKFLIKIKLLIVFLVCFGFSNAQLSPFHADIQHFKTQDSIHFPPKNAILFIGSSSFTKWTDVQNYFPGYTLINRGFGGSSLPDLIHYAGDVIFPYNPRQVVIYCGDNDLAASDTVSAQTVFNRFQHLFAMIREKLPGTSIAFVSIKPSPSRQRLMPKMREANLLIKKYLEQKKNTAFIDVYHTMLNKDGTPLKDIFLEDELHMNAKGYVIWQKVIEPYLLK